MRGEEYGVLEVPDVQNNVCWGRGGDGSEEDERRVDWEEGEFLRSD